MRNYGDRYQGWGSCKCNEGQSPDCELADKDTFKAMQVTSKYLLLQVHRV